jgi:hypothetical protein
VREIQCGREDLQDEDRSGRPALDCIGIKIISILEKTPFGSAHSITQIPNFVVEWKMIVVYSLKFRSIQSENEIDYLIVTAKV